MQTALLTNCPVSSCISEMNNVNLGQYVTGKNLCTLDRDTKQGSCNGDSGSALLALGTESNQAVQVGIVSWGVKNCNTDYPSVYTNVAEFCDYIYTTSGVVCVQPPL